MAGTFRFLEDLALADAAFDVVADSPSELFTAAAQALMESLANPATVGTSWHRDVARRHESLPGLLFDWLSEMVYWKDTDGVVYHEATAIIEQASGEDLWTLTGRLIGEPVDPSRQELRGDVKAITKHLYEAGWVAEGTWRARIVVDL